MDDQSVLDRLAEIKLRVLREKVNSMSTAAAPPPQVAPYPFPYQPPPMSMMPPPVMPDTQADEMMAQLQLSIQAQNDQLEAALRMRAQLRRQAEAAQLQAQRQASDAQMQRVHSVVAALAERAEVAERERSRRELQNAFQSMTQQQNELRALIEARQQEVQRPAVEFPPPNLSHVPHAPQPYHPISAPVPPFHPASLQQYMPAQHVPTPRINAVDPVKPISAINPSAAVVTSAAAAAPIADVPLPSGLEDGQMPIDKAEVINLLKLDGFQLPEEQTQDDANAKPEAVVTVAASAAANTDESGRTQVRAFAQTLRYFLRTREQLRQRATIRREHSIKEFSETLEFNEDLARLWLLPAVQTPLLSVLNEAELDLGGKIQQGSSVDISPAELRSRATKVKVRVAHCFRRLLEMLTSREESVPQGILSFIQTLIAEQAFFPSPDPETGKPGYLLPSEQAALTFNDLGAMVDVTKSQRRMLVLNFMMTRMLAFMFLEPWRSALGITRGDVSTQAARNLRVLASVIYRIVRAALHPTAESNAVAFSQRVASEATKRAAEKRGLEQAIAGGDAEKEIAARDVMTAGLIASDMIAPVAEIDIDPALASRFLPEEETAHCNAIVAEHVRPALELCDRLIAMSNRTVGIIDLAFDVPLGGN